MNNLSTSVIIPFYNGNRFLEECLQSLEEQTLPILECIIVVDNNSELPILNCESRLDVRVINNPESSNGAGLCRYYGYLEAKGNYVAFLDPDDFWDKDKNESHLKFMAERSLAFSFHRYINVDENRNTVKEVTIQSDVSLENFLNKKFTVGCLTVMLNKPLIGDGIEKNYLKRRNDYFMWFGIIKHCLDKKLHWSATNEPLAYHRIHDDALTKSVVKSAFYYWQYLGLVCNGYKQRVVCFASYAKNTIQERF